MKKLFNNDWLFYEASIQNNFDFFSEEVQKATYKSVELPHDWLIYDTNHLYRDSEGWYKKTFSVLEVNQHVYILEFDGIYMDSEVYLNGCKIFEWKYGYTAQIIHLTDYLKAGKNELFVRVRYESPNSRWYTGAGIYRNVWFHELERAYIAPNDCYISTKLIDKKKNQWQITVDTTVQTVNDEESVIELQHELTDNAQDVSSTSEICSFAGIKTIRQSIRVDNPLRWSTDNPYLYQLKTTLTYMGRQQSIAHEIGFREIIMTPDKGLFLNDQPLKIKGVCQHHDLGSLGSAVNLAALARQLDILKEMGANAIRTAHNPFSKEFYQLANQKGFLVQSEILDIWKHPKNENDYARFFEDWIEKDIASWIKRERNFTCIFMWSIGNEIYDTHGREDGIETTKRLLELVATYDYQKNAVITFGSNYLAWENSQNAADLLDCVGYNYGEELYQEHHKKFKNRIIYGSETGSVAQSRKVYHFPLNQAVLADDDYQCSSLGNSQTSWGTKSIEKMILEDNKCAFSLGQFVWSGFDYLGEPTPYSTKNSYLGQIDTAGFPKDSYYIFQSGWISYEERPVIHLFPFWDYSEGQLIDVCVATNAPKVELFFNGSSLGKRTNTQLVQTWQVVYKVGEIVAIAYDNEGNILAKAKESSFGDVTQLKGTTNKEILHANGTDVTFIEINGYDESGLEVKNANNRIFVDIEGPARLLGIDNGDSTDFDQYKENSKRLFNGKLLLIIGSTWESGKVTIKIKSKELPDCLIELISEPAEIIEGSPYPIENSSQSTLLPSVPIRKIELKSKKAISGEYNIQANILPVNADFTCVKWRITDRKGIGTDIGELQSDFFTAKVIPISNGTVYVRCGVYNDKTHIDFYSTTRLKFSGLKETRLNPYREISGGKYTSSNVELTNGNERGVATLRGQESWVVFEKVDFGKKKTSEITFSLFPLESNDFDIDIWQGIPYEAQSKKLDTVRYTMGSIWNTYQDQTFRLKEELTGLRTLSFVFQQKVHMRGFVFTPVTRAFEKISVLNYDYLYGDSYSLKKDRIENIGNNVTIGFREFMLESELATAIAITGLANDNQNSVQIKMVHNNQEDHYTVDFEPSNTVQTKYVPLNGPLTDLVDIEFIFLPGASFNFESFQLIKKSSSR